MYLRKKGKKKGLEEILGENLYDLIIRLLYYIVPIEI